jgi:hypothetical protein
MPTHIRTLLALALVVGLAAPPAYGDAARDVLVEVAKCADIADAAERLKCFDAAMARVKSALAAPQPEQTAPAKSWLDWFGFSRPKPSSTKPEDFGKPAPEPAPAPGELNEISSPVLEFARTPRGKALFVLENGQVWRQIDSDTTVVLDPERGRQLKVKIERGFLDSYNLTIEGRNMMIKVNRIK